MPESPLQVPMGEMADIKTIIAATLNETSQFSPEVKPMTIGNIMENGGSKSFFIDCNIDGC